MGRYTALGFLSDLENKASLVFMPLTSKINIIIIEEVKYKVTVDVIISRD